MSFRLIARGFANFRFDEIVGVHQIRYIGLGRSRSAVLLCSEKSCCNG